MFCGNCGKELISNTRFCQFCGAEQTAVVIPSASTPVSAPINPDTDTASVSDVSSTPITSTPVSSEPIGPTAAGVDVPAGESVPAGFDSVPAGAAASTAVMTEPSVRAELPTPNTIPTNNIGVSETAVYSASLPAAVSSEHTSAKPAESAVIQTEITIKDEEKRTPERKYSLRHIVMCLAAAAVMAVAAGVFAGLYFSVIMAYFRGFSAAYKKITKTIDFFIGILYNIS